MSAAVSVPSEDVGNRLGGLAAELVTSLKSVVFPASLAVVSLMSAESVALMSAAATWVSATVLSVTAVSVASVASVVSAETMQSTSLVSSKAASLPRLLLTL